MGWGKSLFLLIISLFFVSESHLLAQFCSDLTTPGTTQSVFDWTTETYTCWIEQGGQVISKEIPSPFYTSPMNILQANTEYLTNGIKDFLPEDGWELLYYGFGSASTPTDIPSLILYHRPTGKMRILVYLEETGAVDYAELLVEHPDDVSPYISAVLEHANVPVKSLEGYTDSNIQINTPNKIWDTTVGSGETEGVWMVADIPTYYDPCVCQYPSGLSFEIKVANTAGFTIVLEGDGTITQVFPTSSSSGDATSLKNITNRSQLLLTGLSKGSKAYKSWQKFILSLEGILLNRVNNEITPTQAAILAQLGLPTQNLQATDLEALWNLSQGDPTDPNTSYASNLLAELLPGSTEGRLLLPKWIKDVVPYAGAAVALLDFFIGGGKSMSTPKPLFFKASYSFSGAGGFVDSTTIRTYFFKTPGAQEIDAAIPTYNNPLGVLSIVNKLEVTHEQQYDDDEQGALYYDGFQLTHPIQYALNPAAGLEVIPEEIRASIRIITPYPIDVFPPPNTFPVVYPNGLIQVDDTTYRTPYLPLSCLPAYKVRLTDYLPLQVQEPREPPRVFLHLLAKLNKVPYTPGAEEVFLTQLYQVDLVDTPAEIPEDPSLLNIPEVVHLNTVEEFIDQNPHAWNGVVIDGDIVLDADNFFIVDELYPPHEVTITTGSGDVNFVTTASKYDFQLGDVIHGGAVVENLPDCFQPTPPMDVSELAAFCSDPSKYYPLNIPAKEEKPSFPQHIKFKKLKTAEKFVSLFPNPSAGFFNLSLNLEEDQYVKIELRAVTGQEHHTLLENKYMTKGSYHIPIEASHLPKGLYWVRLSLKNLEGAEQTVVMKWMNF